MKKRLVSQGTISVLFGCHSVVHSVLVVKAWRKVHGVWPKPWEIGCIFLHDVGHIGLNYLDNRDEKHEHWKLGAEIAGQLFGAKGYRLVAGHTKSSGPFLSDLYKPDKISWSLAPKWWSISNAIVEPGIRQGQGVLEHVELFQKWVAENISSDDIQETHNAVEELRQLKREENTTHESHMCNLCFKCFDFLRRKPTGDNIAWKGELSNASLCETS